MSFFYSLKPDLSDLFGSPAPVPGVRVVFDPELLFASRERRLGRRVSRELKGDEGLLVRLDARHVLVWPCRLWRVEDVEELIPESPDTPWFRCRAFTVVEELPAWRVFGAHGALVVDVIERARRLTSDQVTRLAEMDDRQEGRLRTVARERWRAAGYRFYGPIGHGVSVVSEAVEKAARRTDDGLFAWDADDEVEQLEDPAWNSARQAAINAAVGLGAPELFDTCERDIITQRWETVIGASPR